MQKIVDKEDKGEINSGRIFEKLLKIAVEKGIDIKFCELQSCYGIITNNCIGLHSSMTLDEINHTLAHELAHVYLHYDKNNIIEDYRSEYEEQAERAANLILTIAKC